MGTAGPYGELRLGRKELDEWLLRTPFPSSHRSSCCCLPSAREAWNVLPDPFLLLQGCNGHSFDSVTNVTRRMRRVQIQRSQMGCLLSLFISPHEKPPWTSCLPSDVSRDHVFLLPAEPARSSLSDIILPTRSKPRKCVFLTLLSPPPLPGL